MKTLINFSIALQNVLLRVDLNVPIKNGVILDETKLFSIKASVDILRNRKNKIFLLTHFGRPKGQIDKKFSTKFLIERLTSILSVDKIFFSNSCYGNRINDLIKIMQPGDICLLENVRFNKGEEINDINFSKKLANSYDIYINDAFSVSHRKHASIVGITKLIPSLAGIGLIDEIKNLNKFLNNPIKPTTAIIGGSKVSSKLKLLNNLVETFNTVIIGGAMANTFLFSQGFSMGNSIIEKDLVVEASHILEKSSIYNNNVILPVDLVCSRNVEDTSNIKIVDVNNVLSDQIAFDVGNKTIKVIKLALLQSKKILWNGPLGAFEYKPFDLGTNEIAEIIKTDIKKLDIITFAGGGDTIAAIKKTNSEKYFTYLSNAGGAFLEWLEGEESPGIKALKENNFF